MTKKILLLAGDGIGPEVSLEARKVLNWLGEHRNFDHHITEDLVGGCCYDAHQCAVRDETVADALASDAVMLGAVGGPQYDNVPRDARPEAGLLRLRKDLQLFANLRPAIVLKALVDSSTLKRDVIEDLDIMILRELTGGVYFGTPRGMEILPDGSKRCVDTQAYNEHEVKRIFDVGVDLARQRGKKIHSVEKANVMETGAFWRDVVTKRHGEIASDITLEHMYADNCAMQLVRNPKQFDVIVTDNLFGDILSDTAAMCTGSLGMLPSASLGAADANGQRKSMYEPVHGSAPDIAGKSLANPCAMILSVSMMMRYSFNRGDDADVITDAINNVLSQNIRTGDIADKDSKIVSTAQMGDAIISEMDKLHKGSSKNG